MFMPMLRQRAFTLLEVLLGMSLMSVMMVLLFASLRICVQNWDAGEAKFVKVSQMAVIENFFFNHMQNLLPVMDDFSEPAQLSFQGNETQVQFASTMPSSAGRLGIQLFTITFDPASDQGGQILVDMRPFFPVADGQVWQMDQVSILKQVKSFSLAYFGLDPQKPDQPGIWLPTWLEQTDTPLLIKIAIEMENGESWPELIIPLKVEKNASASNPFGIVNGRFTN